MASRQSNPSPAPEPGSPRHVALLQVAERIGHGFQDLGLLHRALVHASTGNEGKRSYERLEFLGDAVLGFAVADELFRAAPEASEGELTGRRSKVVSRPPLAEVARRLELSQALEHGRGLRTEELDSDRIQADLVEAVLGAVYLDGGVRAARRFVRRHVLHGLDTDVPLAARPRDAKSQLLHFCQGNGLGQPVYELLATSGPDHELEFEVAVVVAGGRRIATGEGRSKRDAERAAAEAALGILLGEAAAGSEPGPPADRRAETEADDLDAHDDEHGVSDPPHG